MSPLPPLGLKSFAPAYVLEGNYYSIATVTVPSGGATSVTFAGVPSGYKHLELRWIGKDDRGATSDGVEMSFNNDTTASNYAGHRLYGDGGGAVSQGWTSSLDTGWINGSSSGSIFGASIASILDYASTTKNKTIKILGGNDINGGGEAGMYSMLWMNSSSPITSIKLLPANGTTFNQYSHFALYGVK